MLYPTALIYLVLVFLRPTEMFVRLADVPVVLAASIAIAPPLAVALLNRPGLLVQLPADRWLLGYWLAIGLSNLVQGWLGGVLLGISVFGQVVFFHYVIRASVVNEDRLTGLIRVLTAIMGVHALSACVQQWAGWGFGGVLPFTEGGMARSRSVGIFNDPNDLALALVFVLPFLFSGLFGRRAGAFRRALSGAAAVPLLLGLYYTNSRGGMVALGAATAAYGYRRAGRSTGMLLAVALLVVLAALGPSRLEQMDSDEDSAQGRIQAWSEGLQMLKAHPVTGVGFSMFTEYNEIVAHNSFVHAFAELGLIGGTCFVALVYSFFSGLQRVRERAVERGLDDWHEAITSAGVGFFVGAAFLSRQYNVVTFTVLAIGASFIALLSCADARATAEFEPRWSDGVAIGTLAAALLVATWIGVRLFAVWSGA